MSQRCSVAFSRSVAEHFHVSLTVETMLTTKHRRLKLCLVWLLRPMKVGDV